jgi:hypothetical protein
MYKSTSGNDRYSYGELKCNKKAYHIAQLDFLRKKVQKLDTAVLCTAWKHSGLSARAGIQHRGTDTNWLNMNKKKAEHYTTAGS